MSNLHDPGRIRFRHRHGRIVLHQPDYAWTDLTYLLHEANVSWKYYVAEGRQPDCDNDEMTCESKPQTVGTPETWNPLPWFDTVHDDGELGNIQTPGAATSTTRR